MLLTVRPRLPAALGVRQDVGGGGGGRGCKRVAGIRDAELTRHVKGTDGDETFGKVRQLTSD